MADNIQSAKAAFFSLFRWNDECADCDCQKARNKKQKIELRTYTEAKITPDQRTINIAITYIVTTTARAPIQRIINRRRDICHFPQSEAASVGRLFHIKPKVRGRLLAQSSRAGRRVSRQLLGAKQTRAGRPFNIRPIISAKKAASEFRHRQPAG